MKLLFLLGIIFGSLLLVEAGADYYKLLGVPKSSSVQDIKRAYRKLAVQYHPDKHPGDAEKQKKFQEISQAYEVLSDSEKRRIYDQYGEDGLKKGSHSGGFDFTDIFSMFTGSGRQKQSDELPKGNPLNIKLSVTLEDLYNGRDLELVQRRQILCPHCRGTGAENSDDVAQCPECNGSGMKIVTQQLAPGFVQRMQTTCTKCGGKGKTVTSTCHHCRGTKIDIGEQTVNLFIEKGMPDGFEIISEDDGDERPGEEPGDLVFKLVTSPHKKFERKKDDLYMTMPITLLQALIGFKKTFKHLDGHEVVVERTEVTHPGQQVEIQDEGMPIHGHSTEKGKLVITFAIVFPQRISQEQKDGFTKLLVN